MMGNASGHIRKALLTALAIVTACILAGCSKPELSRRYFFLNDYFGFIDYESINKTFGPQTDKDPAVGRGVLIYIFNSPLDEISEKLKTHFAEAEKYDIPVFVEFDPITFWSEVPEIWNWFDPSRPGYNPDNRENVEWYGWGAENAVKIGWLNWGRQIRLEPMANLFSPVYQAAVKERMRPLLTIVEDWYRSLPRNRKYLFGGIKLTGEIGFGFNNWYYPDGNSYYGRPEEDDPQTGVKHFVPPARGVQQTGYAALTYSGIRTEGEITADDIFELERAFCSFILDIAEEFSFPRELLYLHTCGALGDMKASIQPGACPCWTAYWERAMHPEESDVPACIEGMEPPFWGFAEWNIGDNKTEDEWTESLKIGFGLPKMRFATAFNKDLVIKPDGTVYEPAVNAIKSIQRDLH